MLNTYLGFVLVAVWAVITLAAVVTANGKFVGLSIPLGVLIGYLIFKRLI